MLGLEPTTSRWEGAHFFLSLNESSYLLGIIYLSFCLIKCIEISITLLAKLIKFLIVFNYLFLGSNNQ